MIRILILLILGAATFSLSYFFFKSIPLGKKMLVVGGGLAAAVIGVFLQAGYPLYMSLLVLVAVSLLVTLIYMRVLEREQLKRQQRINERRAKTNFSAPHQQHAEPTPIHENTINKSFSMPSISAAGEESKLG